VSEIDSEGRRIHTCSACGTQDVWGPTWSWYGSIRDLDDGAPIFKACSTACAARRDEAVARERLFASIEAAKQAERRLETALKLARADRERAEAKLPRPTTGE